MCEIDRLIKINRKFMTFSSKFMNNQISINFSGKKSRESWMLESISHITTKVSRKKK